MRTGLLHTARRYMTSILVSFICIGTAMAVGNNELKYDTKSPLRIVSETELYPFEYRDDAGNADGFNIKLSAKILGSLNIPYKVTTALRLEANKAFNTNNADLITTPSANRIPGVYYTKTAMVPYKIVLAYTKGKKPIKSLNELKPNDAVIFKEGNYCAEYVKMKKLLKPDQMVYRTVKQGLLGIATGNYQYMVGCEETMKIVMRKYGITNVEFEDIDIPDGEIRFCSRDKMLINMIDEQLADMKQTGEMARIYSQSLVLYTKKGNSFTYVAFGLFVILIMVSILIIVNRYVTKQIKIDMRSTIETNNIMKKALDSINTNITETSVKKRWVTNIYGKDIPTGGISVEESMERMHPDDIKPTAETFHKMLRNETDSAEYTYRYNIGTKENPEWRMYYANAIPEYDKKGNVSSQITTLTDITEETRQEKVDKEMSEIYKHIFDMPIVGLALYGKDGKFIESNHVLKKLFMSNGQDADFFADTSIYDFLAYAGIINYTSYESLHFSTCFAKDGFPNFVEVRIRPIKDDNDELIYHMITVRDKNNEREIYRQSRLNNEQVRLMSEKMMQYENELRYLLKVSKMKVWKSSIKDKTIRLFRDLHTFDEKYTFDEFLANVEEEKRDDALKLVDPRENNGMAHNATILINNRNNEGEQWYAINSIPKFDDDGNVTGSFGLIHNISDLMEAQIKMKKEKERANDSSRLKSTFLANMSHEIRTPLNAIVGFCDIIQAIGSEEEKAEVLKIIHNNCNNLLQIINDILVLSELDSSGLTLNPEECDFAKEFDLLCKSLSQRVSETSVEFITDSPYASLVTTIDKGRISQVITNFLTNAVKHTHEGHIKLGYRVENKGLYIYCEDTGSGIPKDKCERIFDRFIKLNDYVQGAGIGLSICKAIATKCEGKIGVDSEEGKGSTFWIWIPCETAGSEDYTA